MKLRQLILVFISVLLAFTSNTFFIIEAYAKSVRNADIGNYVAFGKYNGEQILWRVVTKDNNGLLLFSDKIISLKSFDAFGDDSEGRGDGNREEYGSNYYPSSNIREWLNSSGEVNYSHQKPDKSHVMGEYNSYDSEPGFLSNFTESERNLISLAKHKVLLSDIDSFVKDGGSEINGYEEDISQCIQNFDQSFYKEITDKVFLLSTKEIKYYLKDRGFDYLGKPTKKALEKSNYKSTQQISLAFDKPWYYWTETPCADKTDYVRVVRYDGKIAYASADCGYVGIRPAMYIKDIEFKFGNGTVGDPYRFNETYNTEQETIYLNKLITINIGQILVLTASTNLTSEKLVWESSNNHVEIEPIKGTNKARIKGAKEGRAYITVSYNGKTEKCIVDSKSTEYVFLPAIQYKDAPKGSEFLYIRNGKYVGKEGFPGDYTEYRKTLKEMTQVEIKDLFSIGTLLTGKVSSLTMFNTIFSETAYAKRYTVGIYKFYRYHLYDVVGKKIYFIPGNHLNKTLLEMKFKDGKPQNMIEYQGYKYVKEELIWAELYDNDRLDVANIWYSKWTPVAQELIPPLGFKWEGDPFIEP